MVEIDADSLHVDVARDIYAEAADFFPSATLPCGYKILNSSPLFQPPVLFLSYQPGGKTPEDYVTSWPDVCQHATNKKWRLARAMRKMFCTDLLEQCCGVTSIFVRARDIALYEEQNGRNARDEIANFCLPRVKRLVNAIKPQAIVAIGLSSLRLFGNTEPGRRRANGDPLVETGKVAGREAISMLHLSGARISIPDRGKIAEDVLAYLKAQRVPVEMVDGLTCGVAEVASVVATRSMLEASAAT